MPECVRQKYQILERKQMIHDLHFPASLKAAQTAERTAVYEEFFLFQARLQDLKKLEQKQTGLLIRYDNDKLKAFIAKLPFELTSAQKKSS